MVGDNSQVPSRSCRGPDASPHLSWAVPDPEVRFRNAEYRGPTGRIGLSSRMRVNPHPKRLGHEGPKLQLDVRRRAVAVPEHR